MCRDVKEDEETTPWAEQQTWESEQIKKASMKVGSKDKKKQEYDLVFEDQIDFIIDHVEKGDLEVELLSNRSQLIAFNLHSLVLLYRGSLSSVNYTPSFSR